MASTTLGFPAARTLPVAAPVMVMGALLATDVVVGAVHLGWNLPSLVAGVAAALAIALPGRPLAAPLAAVVVSLAMTYTSARTGLSDPGTGPNRTLPGIAEIAGLAYLATVSIRAQVRRVGFGVAAAVGVALLAVLSRHDHTGYASLLALGILLVFALGIGAGVHLRAMDRVRADDLARAREQERLAIARELHDVVAHHVTGMVVQAQAALAVWQQRPDAAFTAVERVEHAGADALRSMRRLVETLRDDDATLAPPATTGELHRLAERSTTLGLPVRLHVDGVLPVELAGSVHRIVQEAITNAQRHATGATGVDVSIDARGDELTLRALDDGRPAPRPAAAGYGLTGIAERAAALGGSLRSGPEAGGGWLLEVHLPVRGR